MPQRLANQTTHSFPVTSIDFDKSYKVMLLRIRKGFTDRDLSFLLGYRALYVRDVENPLHKLRYKAKDTNYLLSILDCEITEIMDGKLTEFSYDIFVLMTLNANGTKSFDIYREHSTNENKLIRSFTELSVDQMLPPPSVVKARKVKEYMILLLENGFFKERKTGLEILVDCFAYFGGHIKPIFIENAIKEINKGDALKFSIEKNEMKRWVYCIKK